MEMENTNGSGDSKSILDQIINTKKAEEAATLDAIEIVGALFADLNERERDVLSRRFGLDKRDKETLENIGAFHKLTRERIRQIETSGVKKLRALKDLEVRVSHLRKVINELLEEHGGLMEKDYLLSNLVNFSAGDFANPERVDLHKNNLEFLISKLLHDQFEEVNDHKVFRPSFKLKYQLLDHLEALATELVAEIHSAKEVFKTEDLINKATSLSSFTDNQEKFKAAQVLDISNVLGGELFDEDSNLVNQNKHIYSIMHAAKNIERNRFGHWGIADWREVKPKTVNDKIYLILKHHGKPMHFGEITEQINKISFDGKEANAATVHNELILDKKYVLVGRGLYGLREWGFRTGTVADVIKEILIKADMPMTRDQVIEAVLAQRMVKRATIVLALMNRKMFEKGSDNKYRIVSGD